MPSTLKNTQLAERYLQLVEECYSKPANEKILGSFIAKAFSEPLASRTEGQPRVCNGAKKKKGLPTKSRYSRDVSSCSTEEIREKR